MTLFGTRQSDKVKEIHMYKLSNNGWCRLRYGSSYQDPMFTDWENKHEFKQLRNEPWIDGVRRGAATNSTFTAVTNMYIFAVPKGDGTDGLENYAKGKLYSFKMLNQNNVLLIDLIPVRKNGIGYMYDRVSGQLFGNSGTGQFILGNDIND